MRSLLRLMLGLAACGLLAFSGWKLYEYHAEAAASRTAMTTLADAAVVYRAPETASEPDPEPESDPEEPQAQTPNVPAPAETAPLSADFSVLLEANEDIIAWLYCEDTPISYPVCQAWDNDYYLHRLPDGTYNSTGTLFADYRNAGDFSDLNTIIYGHNMRNDSMFGTLPNYKEQSYYEAHPVLWLLTPAGDYKLELLAGYVTQNDAEIYSGVETYEELEALVEDAVRQSTFSSAVSLEENDRVVTLSTCSYEYENARYVLLARLTEAETDIR